MPPPSLLSAKKSAPREPPPDMTAIFKTPAFRSDYKEIWHYVARDSEYQAGRLLERFDRELLKLAENTLIGRPRPELAPRFAFLEHGALRHLLQSAG